ncbi:hypothetical protein, partial [Staphylococcus epidermidis]|uniref:hypothetical protein n=1 Tax=Staphylococcus epidermidis TaxID=1282 RepID=UPI0011A2136E
MGQKLQEESVVVVGGGGGWGKRGVVVEGIIEGIVRDDVDVDGLVVVRFRNLRGREMKHGVDKGIEEG